MMSYSNGLMNAVTGGRMWIWPIIGVLVLISLAVLIIRGKRSYKNGK